MQTCILLVEDNVPIRENTAELLELAEYSVIAVNDGNKALEALREKKPDLILCDIMMPGMNGYDLLSVIRNEQKLKLPFIFFTAYSEKSEMEKGLKLGANDYVIKPYEPDHLIEVIRKYV